MTSNPAFATPSFTHLHSSNTIPRSHKPPFFRTPHHPPRQPLLAALHPPNAQVDWVIVDVATTDISPSDTQISHTQTDGKSIIRFLLRDAAAELSILLTSDPAIQALNRDHRGKDEPTDVLSFPQHDPDHVILGDVVISLDTATRQATERGMHVRDEVRVLLVHGVLHLLGYDHVGDIEGDWLVMAAMENRVMNALDWEGEGLVSQSQEGVYRDIVQEG